jgi:A/G-specific adenine glycosylase
MLQQTQVKTVIPYWEGWMQELPNVRGLAEADPARLHKLWEGLGYYSRVRNMQRAARVIIEQHNGKFPEKFEEVLDLPGIGRYTAGAVCSIAFNQPRPILDGNVMRVLTRLEGIEGDPRERITNQRLWDLAGKLVERAAATDLRGRRRKRNASHFNQALMELGALVCTPRQPKCDTCPLAHQCIALRDDRVEQLPTARRRPKTTARRFFAFVVRKRNKWLVRQRPAGVVNGHLWEFPNVEVSKGKRNAKELAREAVGFSPKSVVPVLQLKHSITRYRITLNVLRVDGRLPESAAGFEFPNGLGWKSSEQLRELAFTGAHRRILERLDPH